LKKVYDAELYSRQTSVLDFDCQMVKPGTRLTLGGIEIECLCFPEFSHDAVMYRVGSWLFCGDLFSAGKPGKTASPYTRANLAQALERRVFSWHDDLLVFPGEGPPTTLRSEKLFNLSRRTVGLEVQEPPELAGNPREEEP
jgi:glyoxylase-like metal-dependent hydrolase (beta-lactamase superfamily II)